MKLTIVLLFSTIFSGALLVVFSQESMPATVTFQGQAIPLYPQTLDSLPFFPSPFTTEKGEELVTAITQEGKFAVIPATAKGLVVDTADFPTLARTGLHSSIELEQTRMITGRSIAEITEHGRPGRLSTSGFMSEREDVLSVIRGDDRLVRQLGFTNPAMARPLLHILNMMELDISLGRWNMARHEWGNIRCMLYNGKKVFLEAHDTKGGQLSPFDDGLQGAFRILIRRALTPSEEKFLHEKYARLTPEQFAEMKQKLTHIQTGELEAQFIMRYGFYEGHTEWRTDPVAIAFIFGLSSLDEIEDAFPGKLFETLTGHFEDSPLKAGSSHSRTTRDPFEDEDSRLRVRTAAELGKTGAEAAIFRLADMLRDDAWTVRNEAEVALVRIGSEKAVATLSSLLEDDNPIVRTEAAWTLGELGFMSAETSLLESLTDGECGWMAAVSLGKLNSQSAIEPLVKMLNNGSEKERRAAAWALERISTRDSLAPLLQFLHGGDREIRLRAVSAMRKLYLEEIGNVIEKLVM